MPKLASHLVKSRHGIYYLRASVDGRERRISLRTRSPEIAKLAAYQLGAAVMTGKDLLSWRVKAGAVEVETTTDTPEDHARAIEALKVALEKLDGRLGLHSAPPAVTIPHPITIKAGVEAYKRAREGQITTKTASAWASHFARLIDEFQPDQLIHLITPGQITDSLKRLETSGRAIKTIHGYAHSWRMIWHWWIDHGHAEKCPVNSPRFGKAISARMTAEHGRERTPWAGADLKKIFDPLRLAILARPEDAFMPLLALYTGARREALAQLRVGDFYEYTPGCWAVRFDPKFDKMGRERDIPLHPTLIDAGLILYVKDIASLRLADDAIFPHLREIKGAKSHYFGRQFGEHRKALGVSDGSDFHALRTTLISCLALNNCPPQPRRAFVGHETEKLDVHDKNYTKGTYGAARLADEVFPFLNFSVIDFEWPGWKYIPGTGPKAVLQELKKQKNRRAKTVQKADNP